MQQDFLLPVVMTNLHVLYSIFALTGIEVTRCALVAECQDKMGLAQQMEDLRYQGVRVFEEAMKRIEGKDKS
jgi:hypothetical protein